MPKINCVYVDHGLILLNDKTFKPCCQVENFPTISSESNSIKDAYNSNYLKELRENFKNGVKDPICQRCWKDEENGVESLRQFCLKEYNNVYTSDSSGLRLLEISLSNICNLKCRTCYSRDSSKWIYETYHFSEEKNIIKFSQYRKKWLNIYNADSQIVIDLINNHIESLEYLIFYGGEPFMHSLIWEEVLPAIIEKQNAKNINLTFSTNATFWNEEKELILSQFKSCKLWLSIDGLENKFEYIRYPAKWKKVLTNIEKILIWREKNRDKIGVNIVTTVSIYNIFHINEIFDFFNHRDISVYFNILEYPNYLSIQNLPDEIKFHIREKNLKNTFSEKIVNYLFANSQNVDIWNMFLKEIDIRDNFRNENFLETFPEFTKFVGQKKS